MNKNLPDILMGLSVLSIILAAYDFLSKGNIMNLAGTQWILIAIALAIYGLYAKMRTA
jgi:succinate-acetate transporter protein